ncbi:hypothetical protein ACFXEL_06875 [Streptomyces sp. NPDC059382]|uniref:hypothetical protein n=1 Tax=Streptomyces sp. NPDC059382 TaxID=3346816 RepID=UPI0036AB3C0E
MNWEKILRTTGEFVRYASYAAVIEGWLQADPDTAHGLVARYVEASSADERARMDEALVTHAATHFDPQARARMVRLYGTFKVVENLCHGGFR